MFRQAYSRLSVTMEARASASAASLGRTAASVILVHEDNPIKGLTRADYPLSRLIYFNVNRRPDAPLNPAIAAFLTFVLSREGQQVVQRQAIYLPLRATQAEASRALLK